MNPRKPNPGESLAELNPELAKQWHPSKNGELTPFNFVAGSHKKVWWKCPKGDDHEWQAAIRTRVRGIGCPICKNIKAVRSNCLATLDPPLAKEWHPSKNEILTPYDVTPGSHKKVWWKCPKGDDHEWEARVYHRNNGIGCPMCSGQRASKYNNLAASNPKLAKEWHPTRNGDLTPYDVTPNSGKKVWWQNHLGQEWQAQICNRVRKIRNQIDTDQLTLFEDKE